MIKPNRLMFWLSAFTIILFAIQEQTQDLYFASHYPTSLPNNIAHSANNIIVFCIGNYICVQIFLRLRLRQYHKLAAIITTSLSPPTSVHLG